MATEKKDRGDDKSKAKARKNRDKEKKKLKGRTLRQQRRGKDKAKSSRRRPKGRCRRCGARRSAERADVPVSLRSEQSPKDVYDLIDRIYYLVVQSFTGHWALLVTLAVSVIALVLGLSWLTSQVSIQAYQAGAPGNIVPMTILATSGSVLVGVPIALLVRRRTWKRMVKQLSNTDHRRPDERDNTR
jgi:hypothetical protein